MSCGPTFAVLGMHQTCNNSEEWTLSGSIEPFSKFGPLSLHPYAVPPPATPSTGGTITSGWLPAKITRRRRNDHHAISHTNTHRNLYIVIEVLAYTHQSISTKNLHKRNKSSLFPKVVLSTIFPPNSTTVQKLIFRHNTIEKCGQISKSS